MNYYLSIKGEKFSKFAKGKEGSKMKFRKGMALLLAAAFVMTGCGSSGGDEGGSAGGSESSASGSSDALVVYSPQGDEERGAWIMERAKEEIGVDVQFLCAGGGELADRLIAEKNSPQADVVMGLAQTQMYQLKDEGILEAYDPSWREGLPEVYQDKDGYFNSFWQTPIVIAYNTEFVSEEDAPKSWGDLADEKYAGMFGFGPTSSQTTRTYLVGILWNYVDPETGEVSDEGWDVLTQMYANAASMPSTDADIWKAFKDGTIPILPWWYGGVVTNCETNDITPGYVYPESGTPVVAEGIGLVAGSDNAENAKKFIDWWGSAETMAAYAEEFDQAPAHPDAIALCPDEIKESATMFTAQEIDWEVASAHLDEWLEKIELEIMP